jgi:hypothetical protein
MQAFVSMSVAQLNRLCVYGHVHEHEHVYGKDARRAINIAGSLAKLDSRIIIFL